MIPYKDELPWQRFPIITALIILINVVVFAVGLTPAPEEINQEVPQRQVVQQQVWVNEFGQVPCEVLMRCDLQDGEVVVGGTRQHPETEEIPVRDVHPWITVFTSAFLHGGLFHLVFNMLFFWIFASNVEDSMRRLPFLAFFLLAVLVSGLSQTAVDPDSTVPQIGASGAVAGAIGAYLLMYPKARVRTVLIIVFIPLFVKLPAWIVGGVWGIAQFVAASGQVFAPGAEAGGGVAYVAHLAGFVFGLVMSHVLGRRNPIYERIYGEQPGNLPD